MFEFPVEISHLANDMVTIYYKKIFSKFIRGIGSDASCSATLATTLIVNPRFQKHFAWSHLGDFAAGPTLLSMESISFVDHETGFKRSIWNLTGVPSDTLCRELSAWRSAYRGAAKAAFDRSFRIQKDVGRIGCAVLSSTTDGDHDGNVDALEEMDPGIFSMVGCAVPPSCSRRKPVPLGDFEGFPPYGLVDSIQLLSRRQGAPRGLA
jgi:hypothetical protein